MYLGNSLYLVGGTLAALVLNYFFHLLCGRYLGPGQYGLLNAYLTVWMAVGAMAGSLQVSVMRSVRRLLDGPERSIGFIRALQARLFPWAVALAVLFVTLGIPFQKAIRHTDYSVLPAFALTCAFWIFIPVMLGLLQGAEVYAVMGIGMVAPYAMRLLATGVALKLGLGVSGVLWAFLIALAISLGICVALVRKSPLSWAPASDRARQFVDDSLRYGLFLSMITGAVSLLMSVDIVLARIFFTEEIAGHFSAASVLGKVPVYVILAITASFLPAVVTLRESREDWFGYVTKRLVFVVVLLAAGCVATYVLGPFVVPLLYGRSYEGAVEFLRLYAGVAFFHGILQVLIQVAMVTRMKGVQVVALLSMLVGFVVIAALGWTPRMLILAVAAVNAAVALLIYALMWRGHQRAGD